MRPWRLEAGGEEGVGGWPSSFLGAGDVVGRRTLVWREVVRRLGFGVGLAWGINRDSTDLRRRGTASRLLVGQGFEGKMLGTEFKSVGHLSKKLTTPQHHHQVLQQ